MAFSRLWQYLAEFFLKWEIFQIKVVENVKTYILFVNFFFSKVLPFMIQFRNMVEPEATDDNMVHALCMLGK